MGKDQFTRLTKTALFCNIIKFIILILAGRNRRNNYRAMEELKMRGKY
jgi:hypothetical protein